MSTALLIIDFQNDFTPPDGALAVEGGAEIVDRLNREARSDEYEVVVATRDWHPPEHGSFEPQGGEWPVHCVQGTAGAELHPDLDREPIDLIYDKGEDPDKGGYSAFEAGELADWLRERNVDRLVIGGLATDVCVHQSALDGLEAGFEVEVLGDAARGVDADDSRKALEEIEEASGTIR